MALLTFLLFTGFVAFYATWKLRRDRLNTQDGYFLGGRSLTGIVIAGSLLLTNISTEHLVGMNGSAYRNGAIIVAWEVTSALALVIAALYFAPRYLKMGLTTIPEFLEKRFDGIDPNAGRPATDSFLCAHLATNRAVHRRPEHRGHFRDFRSVERNGRPGNLNNHCARRHHRCGSMPFLGDLKWWPIRIPLTDSAF